MSNTGKSDIEHMSDGILQIYNNLVQRFFIQVKDLDDKNDNEYLTGLAKTIGFMAQTNSHIHKTFKQEKRLKKVEEQMKNIPLNMQMFNDPQEMQVKYK